MSFAKNILGWFAEHGRKHLPWQQDISPYKVWVSEIMLQQTQVGTVIPYFERFMENFPDVSALAQADENRVLHLWTGLGYYARCRNLHKTAKLIHSEYDGEFPQTVEGLSALPGIGPSTAGAIVAIAYGKRAAILDGNVKRVLCRHHCVEGWPGKSSVQKTLWQYSQEHTPRKNIADYTQAIMDLGSMVCTRTKPDCTNCPLQKTCQAHINNTETDFPHKKPAKNKPVKSCYLLMIKNDDEELLLERRPPAGIWGGLWCFPQIEHKSAIAKSLKARGIKAKTKETHPQIKHSFSHYDLLITPLSLQLDGSSQIIMDSDQRLWYNLSNPPELGLAAPIKNLIHRQVNE